MKSALVTGASGFIGRRVVAQLKSRGWQVMAASRSRPHDAPDVDDWWTGDLTEQGPDLVAATQPSHVLHLAWDARHGLYWSSPENLVWVAATARMAEVFAENGGHRFVMAGTCAEYDWKRCETDIQEDEALIGPASLYGVCKNAAGRVLLSAAATLKFSAATGRVFFCYGEGEHPDRLVSYVCRKLAAGEAVEVSSGRQIRDFMHVDDVAAGFVALLESDLDGAVNIGSGQARSVADIVNTAGRLAGREDLVRLGARPDRPDDPPRIVADTTKLRSTGWQARRSLEDGVLELLDSCYSDKR